MTTKIHPTAIIDSSAILGKNVIVGAYTVIGKNVSIGDNSIIKAQAQIVANTKMGANNIVCAGSILGELAQDISIDPRKDSSDNNWLEIGDNNIFYPHTNISRGLYDKITSIGSNCFFFNQSHLGHDVKVGNNCIISQSVVIGGRSEIGNYVHLGGGTAVHQFCKIGDYAMIGAMILIRKDVLPFFLAAGEPVKHYKINKIGLKRQGFTEERLKNLEKIYRLLRKDIKVNLESLPKSEDINCINYWRNKSTKGFYNIL